MINRIAIQQWSEHAPWIDNAQIEQDLIICRALVSIFSDEFLASQLAFRGGTALHKLYLSPQPRYSEDIDMVQITPGPIKPIMYRLGEVLDWLAIREHIWDEYQHLHDRLIKIENVLAETYFSQEQMTVFRQHVMNQMRHSRNMSSAPSSPMC